MSWLLRTGDPEVPHHVCQPPVIKVKDYLGLDDLMPNGRVGDVWRCSCNRYWVVTAWRSTSKLSPYWRELTGWFDIWKVKRRIKKGGGNNASG